MEQEGTRRFHNFLVSALHPSIKECVNWVPTGAYERRGSCTQDGDILPRPGARVVLSTPGLISCVHLVCRLSNSIQDWLACMAQASARIQVNNLVALPKIGRT